MTEKATISVRRSANNSRKTGKDVIRRVIEVVRLRPLWGKGSQNPAEHRFVVNFCNDVQPLHEDLT